MADSTCSILMIDDNPGDVRLVREAMPEAGVVCSVHAVQNGGEAIAFLRRTPPFERAIRPDLILLDLNLPGENGLQVLEQIKSDLALKSIPVVVLSASAADKDICAAYGLHANCYLTKPIDLERFLREIRLMLEFWFSVVRLPERGCHERA